MIRTELIKSGYHFEERRPRDGIITVLWVFFSLFFMALTALFFFWARGSSEMAQGSPMLINVIFIGTPVLYLVLKFVMTLVFCTDKGSDSVKFSILQKKWMPICFCREALRPWQIIIIYAVPFVLIHAVLFGAGIVTGGDPNFIILLFIMEFFMGLDLCLIVYILYIKLRYKPDYIAVNHHVYGVTLYTRTYVRLNRRRRK